ncbi:MAG: LysR family transcriptional regulator [Caulobacteraceae bacterium]
MNFGAFDLNLLRVFDALMRERSVTRAGDQIGLSQPAVSQALGRLRALLDDQLFVRRGTEMAPTPRAEELAPVIRQALGQVEQALVGARRFDPASLQRTFSLIGADFVSLLMMPPLYARIAGAAPGVRLRLVDTALGEVERLLQDDAVDLAVERPLTVPDWVSREVVFRSPFALVAAAGNPEIAAEEVKPGEALPLDLFCRLPHAIRSIDGSMSGWIDEALAETGRSRTVVLALPQFAGVARAVAQSGLIAALPEQFARAYAESMGLAVYALPMPTGVPEISMYWHSRHDDNPAHRWLREHVRAVAAAL